jgi:hypothetical protein
MGKIEITLTGSTLPHFCSSPKWEPGFSNVICRHIFLCSMICAEK